MATTGYVKGKLIGVYIGGTLVAYGTSGSFEGNTNMINVSNKDSSGNRELLPDEKAYTTNFSGKMRFDAAYGLDEIIIAHEAGTEVTIKISSEVSGDMYLEIAGFISNFNWTADYGDSAIFSFTHEGNGALTKGSVT